MSYDNALAKDELALDALGNPIRREMLRRLAEGPMSVGALAAELPISRPAVSRHLALMKDAALVRDEAVGTRHLFSLNPEGFAALRTWLDGFWREAEVRFRLVAENLVPFEDGPDDR